MAADKSPGWLASFIPVSIRSWMERVDEPIPTTDIPHKQAIRRDEIQDGFKGKSRYKLDCDRLLGRGGFGKVCLAWDKVSNEPRAIKVLSKVGHALESIESEKLGLRFDHPNLAKYYDYIDLQDYAIFVMDLYQGGCIHGYVNQFQQLTQCMAYIIFRQLLEAVQYLHYNRYAHMDIKPENMLFDDPTTMNVVLTDFGLTRYVHANEKLDSITGTIVFLPPEVFNRSGNVDAFAVDMWACGVTLYILAVGKFPYNMYDSNGQTYPDHSILLTPPEWFKLSPELKNIIENLLHHNPIQRLNVRDALDHIWVSAHDKYFLDNGSCGPGVSDQGKFLRFSPGPNIMNGNPRLPWKMNRDAFYKHDFLDDISGQQKKEEFVASGYSTMNDIVPPLGNDHMEGLTWGDMTTEKLPSPGSKAGFDNYYNTYDLWKYINMKDSTYRYAPYVMTYFLDNILDNEGDAWYFYVDDIKLTENLSDLPWTDRRVNRILRRWNGQDVPKSIWNWSGFLPEGRLRIFADPAYKMGEPRMYILEFLGNYQVDRAWIRSDEDGFKKLLLNLIFVGKMPDGKHINKKN
jgi:serine/threonine protein kinase